MTALLTASAANLLWGLSPLYYSRLGVLSPPLLLCAQVVLTFLVLAAFEGVKRGEVSARRLRLSAPTALLIGMNWTAYVVAILQGQALQASYAYLLAPIMTMGLAALVFKEAMSARQKLGFALSVCAVAADSVINRQLPVYGLLIAIPFALYMILHRGRGTASPVAALKAETMLLTPFALAGFFLLPAAGEFAALATGERTLLALLGFINAAPLLLFIKAAPRLNAAQLGACQFIAPITSAVISVWAFGAMLGTAKVLVLACLVLGMGLAVMPRRGDSDGGVHAEA